MLNRLMGIVPNASEHGYLVDHMLEFCHWFMLLLFVGWSIFFLYTIFRFHKSRNPRANYHGVKSKASAHLEFSVVLIEAVLLLGFALPLWGNRVTAEQFPDRDQAFRVRAIGEQFWWNFHYPGADGVFGRQSAYLVSGNNPLGLDPEDPAGKDDVVSKNELHIVNQKPTVIEISAKDVIHSFSVHQMRVTQDAIPGSSIPMWFRPTRPGAYEVVCAQLCGAGHYAMKAMMMVETQAEVDAWLGELAKLRQGATAASSEPSAPNLLATAAPSAAP
jgi:cytochrome c oxidase subunit 2